MLVTDSSFAVFSLAERISKVSQMMGVKKK